MAALVVLGAGCQVEEDDPDVVASPLPTPIDELESFDTTGVVVAASGSVFATSTERTETVNSPQPTSTPVEATSSPGATPTTTPSPTVTQTPVEVETRRTTVFQRGVPGALTIRITDFDGTSECLITVDDRLVILFTEETHMEPEAVVSPATFPENLVGSQVRVLGRVEDTDECIFVAEAITVLT